MYSGCTRSIRNGKNEGVEVEMLRGVKRGDRLSPLQFDVCLDPLLDELQKETAGIKVNTDGNISELTFADDVVLLGEDEKEAQKQITKLNIYLRPLHMKVSGGKCQTFQVVTNRDTWYIKDPEIKLNNAKISFTEPDDAFRYLGAKMGSRSGMNDGINIPELISGIKRARKLSLKPPQKTDLITNSNLSRYIYNLMLNHRCDIVLRNLDDALRLFTARYCGQCKSSERT
jgi:hypothetical protein